MVYFVAVGRSGVGLVPSCLHALAPSLTLLIARCSMLGVSVSVSELSAVCIHIRMVYRPERTIRLGSAGVVRYQSACALWDIGERPMFSF